MMIFENLKILYIEDDLQLIENFKILLEDDISEFNYATNGHDGYQLYREKTPNILILDIDNPQIHGIEIATKIREHDHSIRLIVLTSTPNVANLMSTIELKLTKFITKPYSNEDIFLALSKAQIELANFNTVSKRRLMLKDRYIWDFDNLRLSHDSVEIKLTPKEKGLLNMFFSNPNSTMTYDNIIVEIWNDSSSYNIETLKTMIKNIRKKLPKDIILNIHSIGYKFNQNN